MHHVSEVSVVVSVGGISHGFNTIRRKLQHLIYLTQHDQLSHIWSTFRHQVWSETVSYGLRRDLSVAGPEPSATIPLTLRPATEADLQVLCDITEPGIDQEEIRYRQDRRKSWDSELKDFAWVAVNDAGEPCFLQWMLQSQQNEPKNRVWGKVYPKLREHQALLESVLIPSRFRGMKIMPAAMAMLSIEAAKSGAGEAITFVDVSNIASLKGCFRAGYVPYTQRRATWRLFRERISFEPLAQDAAVPELA